MNRKARFFMTCGLIILAIDLFIFVTSGAERFQPIRAEKLDIVGKDGEYVLFKDGESVFQTSPLKGHAELYTIPQYKIIGVYSLEQLGYEDPVVITVRVDGGILSQIFERYVLVIPEEHIPEKLLSKPPTWLK